MSRSEPDPALGFRPGEKFLADLCALRERAGITRPVVLVAHSFGELITRRYAG